MEKGKLTWSKAVMEVLERIVDDLIRHLVSIDDSQFGITKAVFVVRQGSCKRSI